MNRSALGGAAACMLALSACTSFEPLRPDLAARSVPSRLDEIAYINTLREAFAFEAVGTNGCYNGAELKYFRPTLEQGYPDHTKEQEADLQARCVRFQTLDDKQKDGAITRYLDAGFGLTDLYCQRYFVIAAESDRKRQFERNTGSTVDALVNAVMGIAGASDTALVVANAGFEAYDSTYQNIQDAFMVSPDLANVRKLVHAAQGDFKTRARAEKPASYAEARSVIERYAGMCSYTGMKQLVNDSLTAQTQTLVKADPRQGNAPRPAQGGGAGTELETAAQPSAQAPAQGPALAPPAPAEPTARVPLP